EKILQHQMAVLGGDTFGMKLHAVHRQADMREPHHQTVPGLGIDVKLARHAGALDHQRMIASGAERAVDTVKHARVRMMDVRHFAMHRHRAYHFATERLADGLVAETDAKDRNYRRGPLDQIETNAGFVR